MADLLPAQTFAGANIEVLPIEQGWQPSTVTSIVQSRSGYLWLGTYNGLLRYDGIRFVLFDSGNTEGLQNSRVTSLYEDEQQVLWIGHETGELTRLDQGEFQPVHLAAPWPGGAIETIVADENRDLWLLNASGVLFRIRDSFATEVPGGRSATRKAIMIRAKTGQLWITANGQAATMEKGKLVNFRLKSTLETDYYQAVLPSHDGGIWAAISGSLRKFEGGNWTLEITNLPGAQNPVTSWMQTRSGAVLVGTLNAGLFYVPPGGRPLHFSRTNGLSHDWVRSLFEDHEGNIWIGTGSSLDTLRARKVRMLNPPDAWQGRAVLSFSAKNDGSAWIGTEGAGLYRYNNGDWKRYDESNGLANPFVWSLLATQKGDLLVGTWGGGLLTKSEDRFLPLGEMGQIKAAAVALFESHVGDIWVGTTEGLSQFKEGKLIYSVGKEKLTFPDVRAIAESLDGTIWFGMLGGGLGSYHNGEVKQFRKKDGVVSDFVQCLLAESDGSLWMGTSDNGLARLKSGSFSGVGASQGLSDRSISHLVDDDAGGLWMGSHGGILRVDKSELARCADGEIKSIHPLSYGKADGLASEFCSGGFQPGACKTEDNMLWFPTPKGLAVLDPAHVARNTNEPPVIIEELYVDGLPAWRLAASSVSRKLSTSKQDALQNGKINLAPGKKRFQIRYTALSFAAPEKVFFKRKLDGVDSDWENVGSQRTVEYNYLRPGDYVFHVTGCNNDETWNQAGAALAFSIEPWVWQTFWFQAGAVLVGAAAVGAGVLSLTRRRVRARLEQLEKARAVERERARIARDIHDDLGASLTRISLLSQTARSELEEQAPAAGPVDQIYGTARALTRAMDEIVWAVNPQHDSLDSLATYLGRFAQSFLSTAGLRCRLNVPLKLPSWPLTAEIRHNLFLAFKETLNNVVKHAAATEVRIELELTARGFMLVILDNGRGFVLNESPGCAPIAVDTARSSGGYGLVNIRKRLEEAGGKCEIQSAPGEGTKVCFIITIKK
jgi:signal transduction histidine kinase/ligand-binding sensor domain-containing protein